MDTAASLTQPILVVPLEFERRALLDTAVSQACDIVCCGPGASTVGRWVAGCGSGEQPLILVGLAGSLREDIATGTAYEIAKVIDDDGHEWKPTFKGRDDQTSGSSDLTIVSTHHPVTDSAAKRALAQQTGADLVDMESAAFAAAVSQIQRPWAVVRGVSDGVDDSLPDDIEDWIDERGRTRTAAVIGAIVRRPALIGAVRRLRAQSAAAMDSAAQVIDSML